MDLTPQCAAAACVCVMKYMIQSALQRALGVIVRHVCMITWCCLNDRGGGVQMIDLVFGECST